MPDLSLGFSVAIVGMAGTLIALSIIAFAIYLLGRSFPYQEEGSTPEAQGSKSSPSAPPTRES